MHEKIITKVKKEKYGKTVYTQVISPTEAVIVS